MSNAYRVSCLRRYRDTSGSLPYLNREMSLLELLTELDDMGDQCRVADDISGWASRHGVKSPDELKGSEMVESGVLPETKDGQTRYYRDYLSIFDAEGKPLSPRELFALLVLANIVELREDEQD